MLRSREWSRVLFCGLMFTSASFAAGTTNSTGRMMLETTGVRGTNALCAYVARNPPKDVLALADGSRIKTAEE